DGLDDTAPLPHEQTGRLELTRRLLESQGVRGFTAVSLQTRERCFGALLFPNTHPGGFGASQVRLLLGLAMQIALTLENYVLMHDAQRRTREYELLTQIGQVISAHLDRDEVLIAIQRELGRLFDTANFYVAFLEDDVVRFELEVVNNQILPKRTRPATNA